MDKFANGTQIRFPNTTNWMTITSIGKDRYFLDNSDDYVLFTDIKNYFTRNVSYRMPELDNNLPPVSLFTLKSEAEKILQLIGSEITDEDYRLALYLISLLKNRIDRLEFQLKKEDLS